MTITAKQRERRLNHLGSSDLYELLFGNAYGVWLSKVTEMKDLDHDYLRSGNYMERALLEFARDELGPGKENQYRRVHGLPIGVHVDMIVDETGNPVEAKGALNCLTAADWGEPGTDEIPARVIVQAHGHMMATSKHLCHVPAALVRGHLQFAMFHVTLDDVLVRVIADRSQEFWDTFVVPKVPPDERWTIATAPALKELQRVIRRPDVIVQHHDDKLLDRLETANELVSFCKAGRDALKAQVLGIMGEADTVEFPSGRRYWMKPIKGTKFDKAALEADQPGIVAKYTKPNPYTRGVVIEPKPELEDSQSK